MNCLVVEQTNRLMDVRVTIFRDVLVRATKLENLMDQCVTRDGEQRQGSPPAHMRHIDRGRATAIVRYLNQTATEAGPIIY